MQKAFQHIAKTLGQKKLLLAISGGIDSVVLAHLCLQNKLNFELAHCNFKLRGQESDDDQAFVSRLADEWKIPLHIKVCDVTNATEQNTQIAARIARYEWFLAFKAKHQFDYILTAHHLDDSIETFFINLLRSSGIKGLTGIPENETYLRPLLNATREDIEKYAQKNHLTWREDSSNTSNKYLRNKIRHQVIPAFTDIQPNFKTAMQKSLQYLNQTKNILDKWLSESEKMVVKKIGNDWHIHIGKLEKLVEKELFLHEYLSSFGFTDKRAINKLFTSQSGKTIFSPKHRLTKHQNELIISQAIKKQKTRFEIPAFTKDISVPINLDFRFLEKDHIAMNQIKNAQKNEIYIDAEKLNFPLVLRKWEAGDYFYPLGMKGKKKLSDYFKDIKISIFEKEKIWLLCSQNNIVWIIGHRPDNRYKITDHSKNILHIKFKA